MAKTPDDLRSLARTHSKAALLTLVAVMKHEDATPAARISAANSILERAWGKPTYQTKQHCFQYCRSSRDVTLRRM